MSLLRLYGGRISQADFIRDHLGPVIRRDHPDVKIVPFDHNRDHRKSVLSHTKDYAAFCTVDKLYRCLSSEI